MPPITDADHDLLLWIWREMWMRYKQDEYDGWRTPQMDHWQDVCHNPRRFPDSPDHWGNYWKKGLTRKVESV